MTNTTSTASGALAAASRTLSPYRTSLFLAFFLSLGLSHSAPAATYCVAQLAPGADDRNDGSESHPWKTIARAAAAAGPGDTVVIGDGTYRETVTLSRNGTADRPIRFEAAPAAIAILTGADRITNWTKAPGDANIFSTPWDHDFIGWSPTHAHPSDDYHVLIGRAEQVLIGGKLLRQVLDRGSLARGTFFVDFSEKRLYAWSGDNRNLSEDDTICQAATRSVIWDCRGDYVQTAGLRFRYAANPAQRGAALFSGKGDEIEDCIFEHTNSVGASFLNTDIIVRHCTFKDNGQLGFSADRAHRLQMSDCVISGNNVKGFSRGWEAGGDKIVLSRGVMIERSSFVENHGSGIWFDIGNEDCIVQNCLIADNEDAGLFNEISYGLHAHDNVITGNGLAGTAGAWGASGGICLSNSQRSVIERNLIVSNKEGLDFREQTRTTPRIDHPDAAAEPIWNRDEIIRHNVIAYNRDGQIRGWFDTDNQRHWPAAMQEAGPQPAAAGASLESLKIEISGNFYAASPGQDLLVWGVPWKRNKKYNSLDDVRRELGFDQGSTVGRFNVRNLAQRDFRFAPADLGILRDRYPKGDVPDAKLGPMP